MKEKWKKMKKFKTKMSVSLANGKKQIMDVGELSAYRWKSNDMKSTAIIFRGTDLKFDENWAINFQTKAVNVNLSQYAVNIDSAKIYSGFYRVVHDNLNEFEPLFDDMQIANESILYLSGHSLGSALAQTALLELFGHSETMRRVKNELLAAKDTKLKVISFGGPAIFEDALAKEVELSLNALNGGDDDCNIFMVKKEDDPVTFTGERAHSFLSNVLQSKREKLSISRSASIQFLKLKMKTNKLNEELGKMGLMDVKNVYVHLGQQVIVKSAVGELTSAHIIKRVRVLQHAEYLGASIFSLSRSGNKGWCVNNENIIIEAEARRDDISESFEVETTEFMKEVLEFESMDESIASKTNYSIVYIILYCSFIIFN